MYKFLREVNGKIVSEHGTQYWQIGKKYSVKGKIECCRNGFHASDTPLDALNYVKGEVLAICEGSGNYDKENDKIAWRHMTLLKAYRWTKADSVALAIYAAEQVIDIYEANYPDDKCPRNSIDAAKKWIAEPTEENRTAAYSAYAAANAATNAARAAAYAAYTANAAHAAYTANAAHAANAAYAAAHSAYAATNAARTAAYSANAAAYAAAHAAYAAAQAAGRAAYAAANAAAYADTTDKINAWILAHIDDLEEIPCCCK